MSVIIVDYGMGNLFSVKRILDSLGMKNSVSSQPDDIRKAERVILPGVGSFNKAMENLKKHNLVDALNEAHKNKKPILGICLGMQLMAKNSSEGGQTTGLGWIDAVVDRLEVSPDRRLPHMGWNHIQILQPSPLFKSFLKNPTFYFTHSYRLKQTQAPEVIAVCDYGTPFPASIQADNLFGTQFHPEKSQLNGRILIENFLNWRV